MAFFGAEIRRIKSVETHPNADRLAIGQVEGLSFQFIILKDQFKVGDEVLYIPIESLIPEGIQEKLKLTGKLSGRDKNRLKTITLRGAISQGLVVSPEVVLSSDMRVKTSEEITNFLGITKFEPPEKFSQSGKLIPLPDGYSKYDIEGADRYQEVVDLLMDQEVVVHEKMEGTNFSLVQQTGQIFVNQRQNSIIEEKGGDNLYWIAARKSGLINLLKNSEHDMAIYAELCGPSVQGNIYGLKELTLYVFDIKCDYKWVSFNQFESIMEKLDEVKTAPLIFRGLLRDFLNGRSIQEASNGPSVVNPGHLREGIVVKPVVETRHAFLGRLIIKQRSPEYLSKES